MKFPHIQFYVGDWRKDVGIQSLSYYHRGVWFELLLLMHGSEDRGRLVLNGSPMSDAAIARLIGLSAQEATDAIGVLLSTGVANRDQYGALVNRRMVREEEVRRKRKQAGSIGGRKTDSKREATPYDNDNGIGTDGARSKVREFARGEGIGERDADWFFFKCEANEWTNGGRPIRDWKATVQTWWRAGYFPSQKQQTGGFGEPLQNSPSFGKISQIQYPIAHTGKELTDEQIAKNKAVIAEEKKKLAEKFRPGGAISAP